MKIYNKFINARLPLNIFSDSSEFPYIIMEIHENNVRIESLLHHQLVLYFGLHEVNFHKALTSTFIVKQKICKRTQLRVTNL